LPTGTVTFLFTDIEGSTNLLRDLGDAAYGALLERHRDLVEDAVARAGGSVFGTEGDAVFAVFTTAGQGVAAAVEAQRALAAEPWPGERGPRVRMGLHTGAADLAGGTYVGLDVHRAARIAAAGHGGQLLVSSTTVALAGSALPAGVSVRDLGEHLLKDLPEPEVLAQVDIEGLTTEFPPLRSVDARRNNLPPELTDFVGREREVADVIDLLEGNRLVTLTGPGGTGKTRLSLRAAMQTLPRFADGTYVVQLAPITDPELVVSTIARTLGLQEGEAPIEEVLARHLEPLEMLLVLDNFEQVVAAGPVVPRLLEAAPKLRILVTSREVLHVRGEQEYPVPPLELPDPEHLPPVAQLPQYDAVALFIRRARAVVPTFEVTNDNAPAVAEICARLDGLPLAIELAAARLKLFTPQALLERLSHRLTVLRGGARDLPARQQTLRGAIAWSYDMLEPDEQRLFGRLSVFVGRWTLEAAEEVTGDPDAIDGVASLVDKSLVRRRTAGGEQPRFRMLETIREFGREALADSDEEGEVVGRHADFFLDLAETLGSTLSVTVRLPLVEEIEASHDDIRAALNHATEHGGVERAMRVAGSLWRFWHLRGHFQEGRNRLMDLLARPEAAAPTFARAVALNGLGGMAYWQTDYEAAWRSYDEALGIFRAEGDRARTADVLYSLVYVESLRGNVDLAREHADEVRELFTSLGDRARAAYASVVVGFASSRREDPDVLRAMALEALPAFQEVGDEYGQANCHHLLGIAARRSGRFDEALVYSQASLAMFHRLADVSGEAMLLGGIATILIEAGRLEEGLRVAGAAAAAEDELGGRAPTVLRGFDDPRDLARNAGWSDEQIASPFEAGRRLTLAEAVEEQLATPSG
jgi:predicted ATPase/class 3 adenylate cyclase